MKLEKFVFSHLGSLDTKENVVHVKDHFGAKEYIILAFYVKKYNLRCT